MSKAVKEILLCHHFVPVPVHLLPQVGILAFLQLDQSCDLGVECVLSEVLDLFLKARKKLFYLLINNFRAETKHLQLKVIRDLVSR